MPEFESYQRFKRHIVSPIFDYLFEQLDSQQLLFHQLLRYKTRCECFNYADLIDTIKGYLAKQTEQHRIEKLKQADLYRYFHDEGIDFLIEPKFDEDMVDILASMKNSGQPILVETKLVKERKRKSIRDGYNQIVTYIRRYGTNVGYLAIYNLLSCHIILELDAFQSAFSFLDYGGITVYFLVINVPLERVPASERGPFKAFPITRDQLIAAGDPDDSEDV